MKKHHIRNVLVITLVVLITAAIAAVIVMGGFPEGIRLPGISQTQGYKDDPTEGPSKSVEQTEIQTEVSGMEFPIMLEDGKLEIQSLFAYTGLNPDDENEETRDIAAITLVNRSGAYMAEARITMGLSNGAEAEFIAMDLPAGKRVMAFSTDSVEAPDGTGCTEVRCDAVFDAAASMMAERIAVTVEAMTVTVKNLTGNEISNIVIYCRCPLDEDYFGGIAYQYQINSLPANGTATVDAWDCVLGMAEVVRIEINE